MKFVRLFLQCVGALALALGVALVFYAIKTFSGPSKSVGEDDAIVALNWAGLNTKQQWSIIDGSISARSIGGDHADYYCIQLEDTSVSSAYPTQWEQGPEKNELLSAALKQAIGWAQHEGSTCFPSYEVANSEQVLIKFLHVTIRSRDPSGAQILLLQPATKRLFYVSFDT